MNENIRDEINDTLYNIHTYINNYNYNNVVNIITNNFRQESRCSFCAVHGHNVMNCNNEVLINYEIVLNDKKNELLARQFINSYQRFEIWLLTEQPELLVKSFAIKNCRASSRMSLQRCVTLVARYIWDLSAEDQDYIPFPSIHERLQDSEPDPLPQSIEISRMNPLPNLVEDDDSEGMPELIDIDNESRITSILAYQEYRNFHSIIYQDYYIDISGNSLLFNTEERKHNIVANLISQDCVLEACEECCICYETQNVMQFVKFNCPHKFCGGCVKKTLTGQNPICAFCREKITSLDIYDEVILENLRENLV